jgi:tetratricopeptide (TPR) repeat protein
MSVAVVALSGTLLMALQTEQPAHLKMPQLPFEPAVQRGLQQNLDEHNYAGAEALLIREIEKQPKSAELLTFLGNIFFLDRKFMNCAVAMSKAEKLAPLSEGDQFTLAMAFVALKRPDWARPELEKLHAAHKENASYSYWLGKLEFDGQNLPNAIERFQEAVRLNPQLVRGYDMLGVSRQKAGQHDEAVKAFEEAIRLNRTATPPSAWPPLDYGSMLLEDGKAEEAEPYLREAVKYEPRLAKAHYKLGSSLDTEHKDDEAVTELKRAAQLDPADPQPWHALAKIYRRKGQQRDADDALAEFKKRSTPKN